MWYHKPRSLVTGERVFVRDEDFAWVPAVIQATEEDRVLVQIDLPRDWNQTTLSKSIPNNKNKFKPSKTDSNSPANKERWIELNDYKDRQLPLQNDKAPRDMADLPYLHEAAILYQTKQRHLAQKPYTRVGEIVIAMNPCQWIPGLYSMDQQNFYAKNFVWNVNEDKSAQEDELSNDISVVATSIPSKQSSSVYDRLGIEPHIYEASALAYRGMFLNQRNQTILVSGESGAGKTETVKIILEHLATLEAASLSVSLSVQDDDPTKHGVKVNEFVQKIVKSSPIFEAFGNAKTMRNNNSSRFGKMTRLHFARLENGMWGLRGSTCQTYLLEANRVVSQADTERNFHIFYQLLSAPKDVKEELLGKEWRDTTANDFLYLNRQETTEGETSDREQWTETFAALKLFHWKNESLKTLALALATILRLGNIVFQTSKEGEENGCSITSTFDLLLVSELLNLEPDVLEHAMTHRFVETDKDRVEVPLSADVAKESLDTLVKRIYSYVFNWIVSSINEQTCGLKGDGVISLLDIYGFESFDTNRFEQLCINYANEKLHKKYIDDNFDRFKQEYESEGIEIFDFSKIDNGNIIHLFEGQSGVIGTISEECFRPQGNSTNFVQRIKQLHSESDVLINEKLGGKTQFGVKHFASPVIYDADQFVERNTDSFPTFLVSIISKSKNSIVSGAFIQIQEESAARTTVKSTKKTVLDKFRMEIKALIASIDETQTRYIRCIKPNDSLATSTVDHSTVMRQLKCAGLVAAIDLSRESFPSKLSFAKVDERFQCLVDPTSKEILKELPLHEKVHFMMSLLFAPVLEIYRNCDFTLPYECGKTKVYFRAGALEILESMRQDYYAAKAVVIQAWVRSIQGRENYARLHQTLLCLQAQARMFLQKRRFLAFVKCVSVLQASYQGRSVRHTFLKTRTSIVLIQAVAKGRKERKELRERKKAALAVLSILQTAQYRRQYENKRNAIKKIQSSWRVYRDQDNQAKNLAAFNIQSAWRDLMLRRIISALTIKEAWTSYLQRKARKERSAIKIQSWWRSQLLRQAYCDLQLENYCVSQIQAWWRSRTVERERDTVTCMKSSFGENKVEENEIMSSAQSVTSTLGEVSLMGKRQEVRNLREEIATRDVEIHNLRNNVAAIAFEAENQKQDLESEYEERLADYEDEVLQLREMLQRCEQEKIGLEEEQKTWKKGHEKELYRLKLLLKKTQDSHKEYLTNITSVLDKATEARKVETEKILSEMNETKKEKNHKIASLTRELEAARKELEQLRSGDRQDSSQALRPSDQMDLTFLRERLHALLKPRYILDTVESVSHRSTSTKKKTVDALITQPAETIIKRLCRIVSPGSQQEQGATNNHHSRP